MANSYAWIVLASLITLCSCDYTKRHSPLIDNGVYFYKKLMLKLGTYKIIPQMSIQCSTINIRTTRTLCVRLRWDRNVVL